MYIAQTDPTHDKEALIETESSSTETSASDNELKEELKHEWRKARANEAEAIKGTTVRFRCLISYTHVLASRLEVRLEVRIVPSKEGA